MAWTPYLTKLSEILADNYETAEEASAVLKRAGLKPSRFNLRGASRTMWHGILGEAEKNNDVPAVVAIAKEDFPNNSALLQLESSNVQGPDIATEISWHGEVQSEQLEKIIGKQSTLLPVAFLEVGIQKAHSVVRVERSDGSSGSGFLTNNNLLITNQHVLENKAAAANAIIQFNFQKSATGLHLPYEEFRLNPEKGFATSSEHDWTAVRFAGDPCSKWGGIPLQFADPQRGDRVIIVQHPGGGPKQIALYHNLVVYVGNQRVQYLTDTMPGSSGSPVFDSEWNLVALHHSGGWITEPGSKKEYYRNEGIHINTVIDGLVAFGLHSG